MREKKLGSLMTIKIDVQEIESVRFDGVHDSIIILPKNYQDDDKLRYHSTTLSFFKYAKDKLDINYFSEPKLLVEHRSGEWFGPVLLFTSTALAEYPNLVSIACGVIANYVTDFFKGKNDPRVRLTVLYKETKSTKLTEISYEGCIEGIDKLEESILHIVSKSRQDDE